MNKAVTILILFVTSFSCYAQERQTPFEWNLEKEKVHNEHRNDSTKWSTQNWEADIKNLKVSGEPMINGVFPVPKYELIDNTFNGLGNSGNWKGFELKNKKIIYHSLYVNTNAINKEFIDNKPNEVFFTIVVLTDSIDLKRYTHTDVSITSRNYPHFVGQGFVKTKNNQVDFIAFLTADRNDYALINMRLFDLRIGRIILVAPQKDGTLRSLQLSTNSVMSSEEMDEHIKSLLLNDKAVINFFTVPNTI